MLPNLSWPDMSAAYAILRLQRHTTCLYGHCSQAELPSFAQIVPPDLRNLVYAFDRSFEMAIAALAAPVVGILAEHVFGFAVCVSFVLLKL